MLFFAFGETQVELDAATLPVERERHERITLALDCADQTVNFASVQKHFARSDRIRVYMCRSRRQRGDMRTEQVNFAVLDDCVAFRQVAAPGAQALDFPALQRQAGLEVVLDEIIVTSLAIDGNRPVILLFGILFSGHRGVVFGCCLRTFCFTLGNFRTVTKRMEESVANNAKRASLHGQWSSRLAFVLAVTGSAVGLGNIWKFPYMVGVNGGGAFVLIYLVCVLVIGLPIMMSEIMLGRRGRRNPVATMQILGEEEAGQMKWGLVGFMGVLAGFIILSFYSVIAGWTVAYVFKAVANQFANNDAAAIGEMFGSFIADPVITGFWHTLFMAVTVILVALGVERGLEKAVRFMVPALLFLLLMLLGYAVNSGAFAQGVEFMFRPDFSKVSGGMILAAMGQAFFTLSVGMGAVMAYGAYLPQEASIVRTSVAVVFADTAIAILAGLVIFPIVFANGLDPAEGPGLVFQTLPLAFGQMAGSSIFGTLFFLLLSLAALTSAISLMEPAVAWMIERHLLSRPAAATVVGLIIWLLGFLTVLSFSTLKDMTFLKGTIFDNFDYLTSNIMLPLGGLLITLFAGWVMCGNSSSDELDPAAGKVYRTWRLLTRYVVPVAVALVFLNAVGIFD